MSELSDVGRRFGSGEGRKGKDSFCYIALVCFVFCFEYEKDFVGIEKESKETDKRKSECG